MRSFLACLLASLALAMPVRAAQPAPPQGPPHRIVSLNLCADQLLVELADPGQIVALTRLSRDPAMSAEAKRAIHYPTTPGHAEDVLALHPDLILAGPGFTQSPTGAVLAPRHYRVIELPPADSYGAILAQIRLIARATGHVARGEAIIRRMDADLARIPRPRLHPVAAYYQRRGYMTGTGTLADDLMRRVGLVNLAAVLGKPALSRLDVEEMVAARPDYLIVESATDHVVDQGTEMLHHPALARIPRLRLPEAWTVCGGPFYALAAQSLSAQLRGRH